jgi:cytochrome c-type biogenesis protein CcmH/NrfG
MIYRGGQGGMGTIPGGPLGKARYALANGQADEAERICRKRLEKSPDDVGARVLLAQALLQQSQPADAAAEARRAIRAQATNVDAQLVLSAAMLQRSTLRGVPAEAEQAAQRAVQLAPKQAKTHVQLAEVLVAKRNMAGARAEADEAIRLEPRLAAAHLIRALVLYSDKDPNGAIQASDNALRYDRTLAQAEFIKANALIDVRRYDDALAALDAAERNNPMLLAGPQGHSLRGRIYFKQRKLKHSYAEFLQGQLMGGGRLRALAPVLAGINMVLVGQFGQGAQYAWVVLLAIVLFLILFGLSHIPVAGEWIVAALILGLAVFSAYGFIRQTRGRLFPQDMTLRLTTIAAGLVVTVGIFALALFVIGTISNNLFHIHGSNWWSGFSLTLAGLVGIGAGAAAFYFWPRLLGRSTAA